MLTVMGKSHGDAGSELLFRYSYFLCGAVTSPYFNSTKRFCLNVCKAFKCVLINVCFIIRRNCATFNRNFIPTFLASRWRMSLITTASHNSCLVYGLPMSLLSYLPEDVFSFFSGPDWLWIGRRPRGPLANRKPRAVAVWPLETQ